MFITVFSAVLLALLVYRFLTKATDGQKEKFLDFIKIVVIIWIILAIIVGVVSLIYLYRWEIANIFIFLLWCILAGLPFVLCVLFLSWRKFKKRKELWIIQEGIRRSDFSSDFEKKRYESLTKKEKEIEDERAKKWSKNVLWWLITIPLLLLIWVIILLVWTILDSYL